MYWRTYWLPTERHFCTDTGSKMTSVCHSATTTAHLRLNKPGQQVHKYSGRSNTSKAPLEESLSHRCCQSHAMQVHRERRIHAHTWLVSLATGGRRRRVSNDCVLVHMTFDCVLNNLSFAGIDWCLRPRSQGRSPRHLWNYKITCTHVRAHTRKHINIGENKNV